LIRPILDKVVVRPFDVPEQTSSGIILVPTVKEPPEMGEVLAVGPGKYLKDGQFWKPKVSAGQTVIFIRGSGVVYEGEDGTDYLVLRETDILVVVK
jgi:chaperonin GroES